MSHAAQNFVKIARVRIIITLRLKYKFPCLIQEYAYVVTHPVDWSVGQTVDLYQLPETIQNHSKAEK